MKFFSSHEATFVEIHNFCDHLQLVFRKRSSSKNCDAYVTSLTILTLWLNHRLTYDSHYTEPALALNCPRLTHGLKYIVRLEVIYKSGPARCNVNHPLLQTNSNTVFKVKGTFAVTSRSCVRLDQNCNRPIYSKKHQSA